ncbi:MAG: hypothetical protein KBS45_03180 [Clostridiales bacterium]|nr:hypothetical protein [Candidatus Coliplasma caballi]
MTYDKLLDDFKNGSPNIDETAFYFKGDPKKTEHYIGYSPEFDFPYWIGLCDVPDGCEFKTAEELFEAPVFDGKSIKERWEEIEIFQISGIAIEEWHKMNQNLS